MTNRAEAEKLAMARRIAASIYRMIPDAGDYADVVANGEADRDEAVRAALAAIEEHERLIVAWLRELSTRLVTPDFLAFVGDPFGRDGQQLVGELADMIERAEHLKGTPNDR